MFPFWVSPLIIVAIICGAYFGTHNSHSSSSPSPSTPPPPSPSSTITPGSIPNGTYPPPNPCHGYCTNYQDASIVVSPNYTYYKYTARNGLHTAVSEHSFSGPWKKGPMFSSGDFPLGQFPTGQNNIWAPDIVYLDGVYYLYYTQYSKQAIGDHNLMDIGVATSAEPLGPWQDHGSVGIPAGSYGYSIIGPSLLTSNPPYLTFGSYDHGIYGVEMESPPLTIAHNKGTRKRNLSRQESRDAYAIPEPLAPLIDTPEHNQPQINRFRQKRLVTPQPGTSTTSTTKPKETYRTSPWNPANPYHTTIPGHTMYSKASTNITLLIADQPIPVGKRTNRTEGSFLFPWNGSYFLFYSRGNCCPGHLAPVAEMYRIEYCRGPTPAGPFVDRTGVSCASGRGGTVLLATHDNIVAPGGVGVLNDKYLGPIVYYQYYDLNIGFGIDNLQFGWNYLAFNLDNWPEILGSYAPLNYTQPVPKHSSATPTATTMSTAVVPRW